MIRFRVIEKPVYVELFEVLSVGEKTRHNPWTIYRNCIVDGNEETGKFEIPVLEKKDHPIVVGSLVRYDVSWDDYRVYRLSELENNPKLERA